MALAKKKRGKLTEEVDMVLIGYLAFLDPPKESTESAIKALKKTWSFYKSFDWR